ncbi:MAG TPA: hypothetical protein VHR66_10685 [Gemmataceae bacterium]|jgi:hypothetical protein|nr:hypothetical protein [Gemmataceae bacterium]
MNWTTLLPPITLMGFGLTYCFGSVNELRRHLSGELLRKACEKMGIGLGLIVLGTGMLTQQMLPGAFDFGILIWCQIALIAIVYALGAIIGRAVEKRFGLDFSVEEANYAETHARGD